MEKSGAVPRARFLLLVAAAFWVFILYFRLSAIITGVAISPTERTASFARGYERRSGHGYGDPCRGWYVYMHDLPPQFNANILRGYGEMNGRPRNAAARAGGR
jgi:hypothetical protein